MILIVPICFLCVLIVAMGVWLFRHLRKNDTKPTFEDDIQGSWEDQWKIRYNGRFDENLRKIKVE
jgi:hypothetical protein